MELQPGTEGKDEPMMEKEVKAVSKWRDEIRKRTRVNYSIRGAADTEMTQDTWGGKGLCHGMD